MSYVQIDPVIDAWVKEHKFSLFTHFGGSENSDCRAVYISSENGECCQIWIDKPESGRVSLHAADVESRQDEEMRQDWCVPISELEVALDGAIAFVQNWFKR